VAFNPKGDQPKLQTLVEKEKRLNFSQDVIVYSDPPV